jgi:hypothetical protein
MLPNLRYLQVIRSCNISLNESCLIVWQCNVDYALVLLPRVSKMLVRLSLLSTCNAEGPYLLRAVVPEGVLLALRSLSIHCISINSPGPQEWRHRWREDENGVVSQADVPSKKFDGNYIMSISKAAPNLEELELMGTSDDTLVSPLLFVVTQGRDTVSMQDSITASLSRFLKLQCLTLSGPLLDYIQPFFEWSSSWTEYVRSVSWTERSDLPDSDGYNDCKYAPKSFNEAARDLANGCRTLTVVTMGNIVGDLLIHDGISARIVRECEGGSVKEVKRIRAWGNIIGREEEW